MPVARTTRRAVTCPPEASSRCCEVVAAADRGDLVDDQAGWIGQLAARHGNETGIGKPVSLADADIDHLAFPDIEHAVVSNRRRSRGRG